MTSAWSLSHFEASEYFTVFYLLKVTCFLAFAPWTSLTIALSGWPQVLQLIHFHCILTSTTLCVVQNRNILKAKPRAILYLLQSTTRQFFLHVPKAKFMINASTHVHSWLDACFIIFICPPTPYGRQSGLHKCTKCAHRLCMWQVKSPIQKKQLRWVRQSRRTIRMLDLRRASAGGSV